jgi:hypothetical protein
MHHIYTHHLARTNLLPACKNDDFYWPLALAVTKNATINRFTTATIELLCTSVSSCMFCFFFSVSTLKKTEPFL